VPKVSSNCSTINDNFDAETAVSVILDEGGFMPEADIQNKFFLYRPDSYKDICLLKVFQAVRYQYHSESKGGAK
jgi:hypothetical protein